MTADVHTDAPVVTLERDERGVATLTFTSGDLNLYSLALHAEFDARLDELESRAPRVLVVRSAGRVVSGGVDVNEFYARKTSDDTRALYDRMLELPRRFAALEVPTIFVADGLTLTWALEVALACDLLVASPRARFGLVERVVGLTPFMGGIQRLAARAGVGRAKQVVLTGRRFDAATFERWNVVNELVEQDQLDDHVADLAADLASGPTRAFAALKEAVGVYEEASVGRTDAEITRIASNLFTTVDVQEGMRSFLVDGPGRARFEGH